jgi:DNA repair exonuclease SbcCD nuclease subunit
MIGDPHMTPNSLEEGERLFEFAVAKCIEFNIKKIIIMGDLFDTHALIQSSVLNFYFKLFNKHHDFEFLCLVGNHDHALRNRKEHALVTFKSLSNVTIVDDIMHFEDFDAMPYTGNEEFVELAKQKKSNILLCHHEFNGAQFENGFYSPNGIKSEDISYNQVVSGHIHKIQEFGQIKYVGAPRWIHASDANQERGIWLWDGKKDYKFFSTEDIVGKIIEIKVNENEQLPNFSVNLKRVILKVSGTPKFIQEITEKYLGQAEIVPNITENEESVVSEALGVNQALKKYILNDYKMQYSALNNEDLLKTIINRLNGCGS